MKFLQKLILVLFTLSSLSLSVVSAHTDDTTTVQSFTDVPPENEYYAAVEHLHDYDIIHGNPDSSYEPYAPINRAAFTKIIVEANYTDAEIESCQLAADAFTDVPTDQWYSPYICLASKYQIVEGYSDSSFKPAANINFAEAAKIIVEGFSFEICESDVWYYPYVEVLADLNAIPLTVNSFDQKITRGEMAEIIYRIHAGIDNKTSEDYASLGGGGTLVCPQSSETGQSSNAGGGVEEEPDNSQTTTETGGGTEQADEPDNTEITSTRITVGKAPHGLAVNKSNTKLYVTNFNDGSVGVIDLTSGEMVDTIKVEKGPVNIVLSQDNAIAYVSNELSDTISIIDTAQKTVIDTVFIGDRPHGLTLSPDGSRLYVCNLNSNDVSILNTTNYEIIDRIAVGNSPDSPVVSSSGKMMYVTNYDLDGAPSYVSIIDLDQLQEIDQVAVGINPHGIKLSADDSKLYVTIEGEDKWLVIDTPSREIIAEYATGQSPHALGLSPDGEYLWTGDLKSNTVTIFKTVNGEQVDQIDLHNGADPHTIIFSPDGAYAYIADFFTRSVVVIETSSVY